MQSYPYTGFEADIGGVQLALAVADKGGVVEAKILHLTTADTRAKPDEVLKGELGV